MKKDISEIAKRLRLKGFSLNEIAVKLGVSKSSVSLWVRDVHLNKTIMAILDRKAKNGQKAAAAARRAQTKILEDGYFEDALEELKRFGQLPEKLLCSMIYWCEGAKNPKHGVVFMNSDPELVKKFIYLFKRSFKTDVAKFRVLLHLHDYHNKDKEIDFWSKITNISRNQFLKPYMKESGHLFLKEGYRGCASVRYYDNKIARQLLIYAKAFLKGA
ncbi:MAG: helix-turn-helix domain-containing protein [Patescibacteria group bacterium]